MQPSRRVSRLGGLAAVGLACCGLGPEDHGQGRPAAAVEVDCPTYLAPRGGSLQTIADRNSPCHAGPDAAAAGGGDGDTALLRAWQPLDVATMAGDLAVAPAERELVEAFLAAVRAAGTLDQAVLAKFGATVLSRGRTLVVALASAPEVVFKTADVVTAEGRPDQIGVLRRFARLRKVARACVELGLDRLIVPRALMFQVDDGAGPVTVLAEQRIDFLDDLIVQQEPFWQSAPTHAPALAQLLRLTARTGLDDLAARNVAWVTEAGAPARLALLDIEYFAANPSDALAGTSYPPGLLRMVPPATLEWLLSLAAEEGVIVDDGRRAAARHGAEQQLRHRRALADWQQSRGLVGHPGRPLDAACSGPKGSGQVASLEASVAELVAAFDAAVDRRQGLALDLGARRTVVVEVDGGPGSGTGSPPSP